MNTGSDSEVLLNVFAHELQRAVEGQSLTHAAIFKAVERLHKRCRGAYAVVAMIAGFGLVAFRDPYGVRPLVMGRMENDQGEDSWMVASESVTFDAMGYSRVRDLKPGEAVVVTGDGILEACECASPAALVPCIFEYVYFARPDSIIENTSVYETRLRMGEFLAEKIKRDHADLKIDVRGLGETLQGVLDHVAFSFA